jgi:molybdopterin-containing oxidoreductase family iron-sulfur binding subunit
MDVSRRSFLKDAGSAALGVGCGLPLLNTGCTPGAQEHGESESQSSQLAMVVDIEKCRSESVRQACTAACNLAHNVPDIPDQDEAIHWIWTEQFDHAFPDQVHAYTANAIKQAPVLVLCNHCESPPCVRVCPTQATWKRESDGIVMMDMHRCIGCRYCMAACPYGSRSFNWRDPRDYIEQDENGNFPSSFPTRSKGVVEKCNFCAERLRDGLQPACVDGVNEVEGGEDAIVFGDLADPESEVSRILAERHTISRKVGLGTGPNVYYIV